MVIRLFHAKVRPGKQDEFRKILELLSLPSLKTRSEMVAMYPGQPMGASGNEFVLVTVWKELTSAVTREEWLKKIIPEEALHLIEEFTIDGYKAFGISEPPLRPLFKSL